ncbi:MAG: hypothetical protein AB7G37_15650 [Solirubrobacteraceae bacterium]
MSTTSAVPTGPATPSTDARRRTLARAGAASGALMIIGGAGPWVNTNVETIYGYDRDGAIYIGMGVLVILFMLWRGARSRWPSIVTLIFGVVGIVAGAIDLESVTDPEGFVRLVDPSAGWALYLAIVASVIAVGVAIALIVRPRNRG